MKRIKDRGNFEVNLHFLMESNKESGLKANGNLLRTLAYRFSLWEENNVFSLENRYETFREEIVSLDYDEILEMYLLTVVHPDMKESYWDDACYKFFRENLSEQINNMSLPHENKVNCFVELTLNNKCYEHESEIYLDLCSWNSYRYCFDFCCRPFYGEISSNIYIKQRCSDV